MENYDDNQDEEMSTGAQSQSPECTFPLSDENVKTKNANNVDVSKAHEGIVEVAIKTATIKEKSEEESLLRQLLVAIERLSTSLESMDKTNSALLMAFINQSKNEAPPIPTPVTHWALQNRSPKVNDASVKETGKGKGVSMTEDEVAPKEHLNKLKDLSTILISSDDDDRLKKTEDLPSGMFVRGSHKGSKPNLKKTSFQQTEDIESGMDNAQMTSKPFSFNYRFGLQGEMTPRQPTGLPFVRKLAFTPAEMERANKKSKPESSRISKRPSPSKKGSKGEASSLRSIGQPLPKHVSAKFKPIPSMRLSPTATKVAIYVFQASLESCEVLFKVGTNQGTRADFDTLCPGKKVTREIILMTALRITCSQLNNDIRSVWCLPPSFADDVAIGSSSEMLITYYGRDWMGCYDHLSHVYVPIIDIYGHCFLMVISIKEKKIYLLDSCLADVVLDSRQYNIRKQAAALGTMVSTMYEGVLSDAKGLDFGNYEIEQARGVPKCVNSDTSGLWVAEWMHMQHNFTNNVIGVLDENHVRMEVAIRILLDDNNECKKELIHKAGKYWLQVTGSPII